MHSDDNRRIQREDFARSLTWLIDERGISQRQLAESLGRASYGPFYKWFRAEAEPAPAEVFAIEKVLEVPPGTLSRTLGYLPPEARTGGPATIAFDDALRSHPFLPVEAKDVIRFMVKRYEPKVPGHRRKAAGAKDGE